MKSEHPTNFGKIPNTEKSISVNFRETDDPDPRTG